MKIVILGAGIAGISAAYHAKLAGFTDIVVYEQSSRMGGLLDNFEIQGFRFDHAVHLSFTKNAYVKDLFQKTAHHAHKPLSFNYDNGTWLKHPVQNNLFPLATEEKIKAIQSFVEKPSFMEGNYKQWLYSHYGEYIAEKYPMRYTRKYWATNAENLSTDWVGNRLSTLDLKDILRGAFENETDNFYYADEMRYPLNGGYKAFIQFMIDEIAPYVKLSKKVKFINEIEKTIQLEDDEIDYYDALISSIPLPVFVNSCSSTSQNLKERASRLKATSIALVSVGFNRPDIPKHLWFYIYDEHILPARAYSPSLKSVYNVPAGCSSLQFEIYFDRDNTNYNRDKVINSIRHNLADMKIAQPEDILFMDYREVEFGNVVFNEGMVTDRDYIKAYYKNKDISLIGRFGEWDYLWSDQSLLSGKNAIDNLVKERSH